MTTEIRDFRDRSLVKMKPMEQCRYYPKCEAPLCPLDNQALGTAIWYPDEPICRRKGLPDTRWLSIQRRIARKAVHRDLFFQISDLKKIKKNPIYIVLDNVLDTYNIGSIFRLADAVAAEKIFLCGQTETPPNSRIKKASVNTWKWVSWSYATSAQKALSSIKSQVSSLKIYAVEQTPKSVLYNKVDYQLPCAVVVGHETEGVSKEILEMADKIVEIPMFGVNKSLNVMVSCGIVLYQIMSKCLP